MIHELHKSVGVSDEGDQPIVVVGFLEVWRGQGQAAHTCFQHVSRQFCFTLEVLFRFPLFYPVKGRLGDIQITAVDEFLHLAIEKGQKECSDVGSINVCIRHDDDLVIPEFFQINIRCHTGTKRSDDCPDLRVG